MPLDPLRGFETGYKVGSTGRKPLQGVLEDFETGMAEKRKFKHDVALERVKNEPTAKDKAMTDYYTASADMMKGGSMSNPQDVSSIASQSGFSEEDYIMNPTVTRYRGQTKVVNTPQLKPPLDVKSRTELGAFRRTSQNLQNNLSMMEKPGVSNRMGPFLAGKFTSGRNPMANAFLGLQSMGGDETAKNFITFKAETDKVFQQFRKETTGAQAALKELGWLEPDYPQASDPPSVYMSKAKEAMKRLQEGESLLLDLHSQGGYRTSELRSGSPFGQSNRADNAEDASNEQETKVVNGVAYIKVPGGWKRKTS